MIHKLTLWAVSAALVATVTGCNCCQATDTGTAAQTADAGTAAPAKAPVPPTAKKPCKAILPDGEVLWIVAEWDACCTPGPKPGCKPCKNARCWKTTDGRVLCVKPLKKCPKNGKGCPASAHYRSKAHHCIMCTQDDPAAPATGKFAAKVVKPCPVNGSAACKAKDHVNLAGGKKGCAKADAAAPADPNVPVDMSDSFESDEVFEITSVN